MPGQTDRLTSFASLNQLPAATPALVHHVLSLMSGHNTGSGLYCGPRKENLASVTADFLKLSRQRAHALIKALDLVLVHTHSLDCTRGILDRALIHWAERGLFNGAKQRRFLA